MRPLPTTRHPFPHPFSLLLVALLSRSEVARASSFSTVRRHHAAFIPSSPSTAVSNSRRTPTITDWRCNNASVSSNNKHHRIPSWNSNFALREKDGADGSDGNNNRSSFAKYGRPQDITSSTFGPLLPLAEAVDAATGGWGLSYADLAPATPRTPVGRLFLATNLGYAAAGLWLGLRGDWLYGGLTELAGLVSFAYHYAQLDLGRNRAEVRLALLVDYLVAGAALLTGGAYLVQAGVATAAWTTLASAAAALVCLGLCWVWEFGYPYIFWHSMWHVASAYTGYLVGQEHLEHLDKIA